ncbi:caspase-9-like [Dendronephthya gigantea]|nr:caspase-9-like [Dendronephthya gigantea]
MGAKGQSVTVDELLSPFRKFNSSLVGKPKIFMIQKCRGKEVSMGIREPNALAAEPSVNASASSLPSVPSEGLPSHPNVESSGYLPLQADHLIAFSTSPGYVAYRDTECGSWYIDELTRALCEEYGSEGRRNRNPRHLVDVITHVQGMVSNRIQGKFKVQMPEFRSTLRGPIYF